MNLIEFFICKPFGHSYKHRRSLYDLKKELKNEFDHFKKIIVCSRCGDERVVNRDSKPH